MRQVDRVESVDVGLGVAGDRALPARDRVERDLVATLVVNCVVLGSLKWIAAPNRSRRIGPARI
ncbi:MAG: hypothetical protein ACYTFH_09690, partial [Planctomycetota bacterium]